MSLRLISFWVTPGSIDKSGVLAAFPKIDVEPPLESTRSGKVHHNQLQLTLIFVTGALTYSTLDPLYNIPPNEFLRD